MTPNHKERRKFKRVLLTAETALIAHLVVSGSPPTPLKGNIVDLSVGGFQFTLKRNANPPLGQGDRLTLAKIAGAPELDAISDLPVRIVWVLDHRFFEHIGLGCQFIQMAPETQHQIDQFISNCTSTGA